MEKKDRKERNTAIIDHAGNEQLIGRYNINDKAHEESSIDDFVDTTSSFRRSDGNPPRPSSEDLEPGKGPHHS